MADERSSRLHQRKQWQAVPFLWDRLWQHLTTSKILHSHKCDMHCYCLIAIAYSPLEKSQLRPSKWRSLLPRLLSHSGLLSFPTGWKLPTFIYPLAEKFADEDPSKMNRRDSAELTAFMTAIMWTGAVHGDMSCHCWRPHTIVVNVCYGNLDGFVGVNITIILTTSLEENRHFESVEKSIKYVLVVV